MSSNSILAPTRPLLWKMDSAPRLDKLPASVAAAPARSPWPEEMTREATNPLLAKWHLNALTGSSAEHVQESVRSLDDGALRDMSSDDNPFVLQTEQATLSMEKALIQIDAEWDRLLSQNADGRSVYLSVHRMTPQLILNLDDAVCAALLRALHHNSQQLLVAWEETERSGDVVDGLLCSPVSAAAALVLSMALQSEEAFAKVCLLSPAGVLEAALAETHGDAMLALDYLADMLSRLLVQGLRPDAPTWREEAAVASNAAAILTHWLLRVQNGEANPSDSAAAEDRLPQNSMVAGATAAVFIAAATRFFERARANKTGGNLQRTVQDAWHVYKQIVNLSWLPLPLEQRILSAVANDTPEGYEILREHARSLKVPRLNATLFADWLGLALSWFGLYTPAHPAKIGS